jgi:acyl dehydratase
VNASTRTPDLFPFGFHYEVHKLVTANDIYLWATLTGDTSTISSPSAFAHQANDVRHVVPGAYLTGLTVAIITRLAARVPDPDVTLATLTVHFAAPVPVGSTVHVAVTVAGCDTAAGLYWLDLRMTHADGAPALLGKAALRPSTTWSAA